MNERVERKLRCPKDWALLAQVEATPAGRVLVTRPGRVGDDKQQRHELGAALHKSIGLNPSNITGKSVKVDEVRYTVVDTDPYAGVDELDAIAEQEHYRRRGEGHVWPGAHLVVACPKCRSGYLIEIRGIRTFEVVQRPRR